MQKFIFFMEKYHFTLIKFLIILNFSKSIFNIITYISHNWTRWGGILCQYE